jgi:hypothetical protein
VVLRLRRAGVLVGQVRQEDGSAPQAFTVTLSGGAGASFGGGDGGFRLEAVPAGAYTLFISGPGFVTKAVPQVTVEED